MMPILAMLPFLVFIIANCLKNHEACRKENEQ